MTEQATEAIRRLVEDAQRNQSDTERLMGLHVPDAVIVNIAGRRVLGRDAFRQAMEQSLASPLAKVTTTTEIEDVRFVRPDVAVVSCVKRVLDERAEGDALPTTGSLTYVVVEDGGAWRIALAQTTPVRSA